MKIHELKVWPEFYEALVEDDKCFEVRKNDRAFEVGDILHLREWDTILGKYTGAAAIAVVDYIMDLGEPFNVAPGYVVMGISLLHDNE